MAVDKDQSESIGTPEDPNPGLSAAVRRILRPLVRLLISRNLLFPSVSNILRGLYIELAVDEFPVAGKRQTDSRISLLTGVHRKDVRRLRDDRHPTPKPSRTASLASQLIARWTTIPEYLDAQGQPRPLPRLPRKRIEQSFESLVRTVNKDIRPRVVLDEWLRLGVAHLDADDCVRLDAQAFVAAPGSEEMTYYFGRNLHDHTAAAVHNVLGQTPPLLERSVNYNNLSPAAVAELKELAQRRGMEVLQEINACALQLQKETSGLPGSSQRLNVGLYVFNEDEEAAPTRKESGDDR